MVKAWGVCEGFAESWSVSDCDEKVCFLQGGSLDSNITMAVAGTAL